MPSARGDLAVGYGRPFWTAVVATGQATTTAEFFALFAGVRSTLPMLDVAFGVRNAWSYHRGYFPERGNYTHMDVTSSVRPKAAILSLLLEANAALPFVGGFVVAGVVWTKPLDLPMGTAAYDEPQRFVVGSRGALVTRLGYSFELDARSQLRLGPWIETIFVPRSASPILRVGPVGSVRLTERVDLLGGLTLPVASGDDLGLFLGSFGFLIARYRFATDDTRPGLP